MYQTDTPGGRVVGDYTTKLLMGHPHLWERLNKAVRSIFGYEFRWTLQYDKLDRYIFSGIARYSTHIKPGSHHSTTILFASRQALTTAPHIAAVLVEKTPIVHLVRDVSYWSLQTHRL
jgi:hypothetical protein